MPVHPQSRKYLLFCLGSQVYQFRVLCFGLSSAPLVFTRVMAPVSSTMHRSGYSILRYLDDWLVLGSSQLEMTRARDFLLLCADLGIRINTAKSSLHPSQRLGYLGMTLQSTPLRAFPTQARIHKVLCLVDEFSSSPEQPLSLWRSLLGVMSSLSTLIPSSRLRMRSLQHRSVSLSSSRISNDSRLLGRLLPEGSSVVVRTVPSHRGVDLSLPRRILSVHRRIRHGLGRLAWIRPSVRLVVSRDIVFDQPPRTPGDLPGHSGFSSPPARPDSVPLHGQHVRPVLSPQGRGHSIFHPQRGGSGDSPSMRILRSSSAPPVIQKQTF